MSTATVTLDGQDFTLSALPLRTLASLWKQVVVLITLVLASLRAIGTVGKELGIQGRETPSVGQIMSTIAGGAITQALEDVVAKASPDQFDALLDVLWESVKLRHKSLERESFEEMITLATLPSLLIAFMEAQGLKLSKEKEEGGAPGEAPAALTA